MAVADRPEQNQPHCQRQQYAGVAPAFDVECERRAHRLFGKGHRVHGGVGMVHRHHIQGLRDQRQEHDALHIAQHIMRIDAADRQAVGVDRKGDAPDDAHDAILRKEDRAHVVDQHGDNGDEFEEPRVRIEAYVHVLKRPRDAQISLFCHAATPAPAPPAKASRWRRCCCPIPGARCRYRCARGWRDEPHSR